MSTNNQTMKLTMKLLALFFGVLLLANIAYAESPREQLKQMIERLQKSPNDNALREQIIKVAQGLNPAPVMPDEAERRMARGTEAFKEAKSTADYQAAVKEFQQATLAAPWSADAYFNLGVAQDKAEDFEGSLRSLRLAQLASPGSKDIKDLYYKVEYQRDKFAEQNSAAAKEAAQRAAVYQGLDGGVWRLVEEYNHFNDSPWDKGNVERDLPNHFMEVHGHKISKWYLFQGERVDYFKTTFESREFNVKPEDLQQKFDSAKVTISEDGRSMTVEVSRHSYNNRIEEREVYQRIK